MSNNTLRKIISFILSFIIMVCMVVGIISAWLIFEVLNYDALKVKVGDEFYPLLHKEVCNSVLLQTVSTGIPDDIMLEPITQETVDYWTRYQMEAIMDGRKYDIDLTEIRDSYIVTFTDYAAETGSSMDEKGAKELANYCVSIIKNSIELPFGNLISSYISIAEHYLPYAVIVCVAAVIFLAVFLQRISKPRITMTKYFGISFCSVGIIGLVLAVVSLATGFYNEINIMSDAYKSAIIGYGDYILRSLLMLSAVVFLIGAVSLVVYSVYGGGEKEEIV